MRIFTKVDQFGIPINIKVKGKEKYTSNLGALLTILSLVASGVVFYFMGTDLWELRNPTVIPNEIRHEKMQSINLSEEKYPILLNLRYFKNEKYDFNLPNTAYNLLVEYHHYENSKPGENKKICDCFFDLLTDCNNHSVKKLDFYKDKDLSIYKCVDIKKIEAECRKQTKDPNYEVLLEGELSDPVWRYLRISVQSFEFNKDKKVSRFSTEEDLAAFTNVHFHIQYPSISLNNQLSVNPLKTIGMEEQHLLRSDTYKFEWKWFKQITFLDDQGWLGESIDITHSMELERDRSDFFNLIFRSNKQNIYYRSLLMMSHTEQEHHRRYIKLTDILAISASFIKGISTICFFYVLWRGQEQLDRELVNELFTLDKNQLHADLTEIKKDSFVSTTEIVKKKEEVTEPTLFQRLCNCWKKKENTKVSNQSILNAISFMKSKLEVTALIKLFDQFEKMKEFLLNQEQQKEMENSKKINFM